MGKKITQKEFIERAKKIHGNKYDYSKVEYKNCEEKVCIICPEHGEFWQTPLVHIYKGGCGCRECRKEKLHFKFKSDTDEFIEEARKVHGNKYDYSKVDYKNAHEKVCIICPKHGEFEQAPCSHLSGRGCYRCGREHSGVEAAKRNASNTDEFIEKAKKIHGDKYDYSKVEYKNNRTPVCIICPEHGEFWQSPQVHLKGGGCPTCNESRLEKEVYSFLSSKHIRFEQEKTFEWLVNKGHLYLDFYLPEYNIAIECQGDQHFIPVDFGGTLNEAEKKEKFSIVKNRDAIKKELCEKHGIKILYYFKNNYFLNRGLYTENNILRNINDLRL